MVVYSVDLRERVVAAVDGGLTQAQAAERFSVSLTSVERWMARRRASGSLAPTIQRHGPPPVIKDALHAWLPARLAVADDATLAQHAAAFADQRGLTAAISTISRAIAALPPPGDDTGSALTPTGRARAPGWPLKQRPSAPSNATK